jgi:hypothetical protein
VRSSYSGSVNGRVLAHEVHPALEAKEGRLRGAASLLPERLGRFGRRRLPPLPADSLDAEMAFRERVDNVGLGRVTFDHES